MASRPETERLFFAFWPDEAVRHAIYKETRHAVRVSGGRPVPPENFHVTLVFLGSVDAATAVAVREAAAGIQSEPFSLCLDRLGFWKEPRVVWLGADEIPDPGRRLAASLLAALRARGLKPDPKSFTPHVTLARKISKPGELGTLRPIRWPVQDFVLMRSITHAKGSEYQPLAAWPLMAQAAG
ncbi:MAG: RNA 2',3'-cyclic phosphodiesterase [Gammaproteobacteria bacterium]